MVDLISTPRRFEREVGTSKYRSEKVPTYSCYSINYLVHAMAVSTQNEKTAFEGHPVVEEMALHSLGLECQGRY